ncbi:glycosyltransferase family 2 protein [Hymenobacter sp. BRD128]|uniref:glycosyltransferase family 2 protein n=1 Tax=Hymenobacter sp. BRD128 TaxID=2675878 RepID=UPI00156491BF|nr:glycosyltransferase family A protein [Hymenobacter sp. BRD128]QKG55507.1 glycosyltransferase family 2 protein [Hymenobacter sp. BRD128]
MPKVSVVLPVYNVAAHIRGTIESLLRQTYPDFELLILDDCSTDDTVAQIQQLADPRLRLIRNGRNLGRAGTDNAALPHVQGEYIAKMDGDDICHPERLAKQVAYLDAHPEVNIVGSFMQNFGASTYLNRYPAQPADTQVLTLFTLPTGNPSAMMRTSLFREQGLRYNASLRQTEDYDFCARYIRQLRIATIQEALINYRVPVRTQKQAILNERESVSDHVREQLLRDWGIPFTARELHVYNTLAMLERPPGDVTLAEVDAWLRKLLAFNERQPLFEPAALQRGLGERWFEVCYTYPQRRLGALREFRNSPLAAYSAVAGRQHLKFIVKAFRQF